MADCRTPGNRTGGDRTAVARGLATLARDAWITIKPNGPDAKGSHVEIGAGGKVIAGMGGKFNGKPIGKAHGSAEAPKAKPAKLTGTEKAAAEWYSGQGSSEINKGLRAGKTSLSKTVASIDSAIGKSTLPAGKVLYRGISRDDLKKLIGSGTINKGDTFSDPAFASTSSGYGTAANYGGGVNGAVLQIECGEGQKGLDMKGVSLNQTEGEILLPRNTKMRVTGIVAPKKPGQPVIVKVTTDPSDDARVAKDCAPGWTALARAWKPTAADCGLATDAAQGWRRIAMDADRFITVHPNGPDTKGVPVKIDEHGTIKGGMGGKFNGKNISEAHGKTGRANSRASAHAAFGGGEKPNASAKKATVTHILSKPGTKTEKRGRREVHVPSTMHAVEYEKNGRKFSTGWTSYKSEAEGWAKSIETQGSSMAGREYPSIIDDPDMAHVAKSITRTPWQDGQATSAKPAEQPAGIGHNNPPAPFSSAPVKAEAEKPKGEAKPSTPTPSPTSREEGKAEGAHVLRNKQTGEVMMETSDPKKIAALNTEKYEAVPIAQHLSEISERAKGTPAGGIYGAWNGSTAPTPKPAPVKAETERHSDKMEKNAIEAAERQREERAARKQAAGEYLQKRSDRAARETPFLGGAEMFPKATKTGAAPVPLWQRAKPARDANPTAMGWHALARAWG